MLSPDWIGYYYITEWDYSKSTASGAKNYDILRLRGTICTAVRFGTSQEWADTGRLYWPTIEIIRIEAKRRLLAGGRFTWKKRCDLETPFEGGWLAPPAACTKYPLHKIEAQRICNLFSAKPGNSRHSLCLI